MLERPLGAAEVYAVEKALSGHDVNRIIPLCRFIKEDLHPVVSATVIEQRMPCLEGFHAWLERGDPGLLVRKHLQSIRQRCKGRLSRPGTAATSSRISQRLRERPRSEKVGEERGGCCRHRPHIFCCLRHKSVITVGPTILLLGEGAHRSDDVPLADLHAALGRCRTEL